VDVFFETRCIRITGFSFSFSLLNFYDIYIYVTCLFIIIHLLLLCSKICRHVFFTWDISNAHVMITFSNFTFLLALLWLVNQSVDQSINQSISQSVSQSVSQLVN